MATHLSDDVLLEMVEAGKSHPHLAECNRCRRVFEEAREALALARAGEVPEPSPLFWDHFSARVHEAVDNEADVGRQRAFSWFSTTGWRPIAALGLVLACAVVVWLASSDLRSGVSQSASARNDRGRPTQAAAAAIDVQPAGVELIDPASDPSWTVIAQIAAEAELEPAVNPGATDRAAALLSVDERHEFVRLLQNDLGGPPSP